MSGPRTLPPRRAAGNPILVSVASPIWDGAQGNSGAKSLGVLSATVHLETFNQWLVEAEGVKTETGCPGRFAVLLNRGQLVRHPCPAQRDARLPLSRETYFEKEEVQRLLQDDSAYAADYRDPLRGGRSHLAAYVRFRENRDWLAIVEHDREVALSPITSLVGSFSTLAWTAAVSGILLVLALWALLFRVTRERPEAPPKRAGLIELDL